MATRRDQAVQILSCRFQPPQTALPPDPAALAHMNLKR